MEDQQQRLINDNVKGLEQELGIAPGFLEAVMKEADDWSFVIKVHALAEAAITHLLTNALNREELRDIIAAITMGDSRRGKLAFVAKLKLLEPDIIQFFQTLGSIRNWFAHDVKSVALRIEDYVNNRPVNERDSVWRRLCCFVFPTDDTFLLYDEKPAIPVITFAKENPRRAIWFSAMNAIAIIYVIKGAEVSRHRHQKHMADVAGELLKHAVRRPESTG